MKNRTIVVPPVTCNSRSGGPSGFCAQLLLSQADSLDLDILDRRPSFSGRAPLLRFTLASLMDSFSAGRTTFSRGLRPEALDAKRIDLNSYKNLWFHSVLDLHTFLPFIGSNQTVILQPHCPELPWLEDHIEDQGSFEAITRRSFDRANTVVLPNADCRHIYDSLLNATHNVFYLPSACEKQVVRCQLPLEKTRKYLVFVGRRNSIKGFDFALTLFAEIYRLDHTYCLLLIGDGSPVDQLGVVDLGRQTDIASWVAASSAVLNCNRDSYFDLSLMECMSLATPIFYSFTGGHKALNEHQSPGLSSFSRTETISDIARQLIDFVETCGSRTDTIAENLKNTWARHYSPQAYRQRLNDFLKTI